MGALDEILKFHTDKGGDLRSVPLKLLNDAINTDLPFTTHELDIMYMLVCQKKDWNRKSERVTTLHQWITTLEIPDNDTATDSESETSIQAELKAEERKLWRRVAGRSEEQQEQ